MSQGSRLKLLLIYQTKHYQYNNGYFHEEKRDSSNDYRHV